MSSSQNPILLYTGLTPNGFLITIYLEALKTLVPGFNYDYETIDVFGTRQKEPWFIKLNPNGLIPVIVDRSRNDYAVFETSAILLYLAQHYDTQHKFWFNPETEQNEYSELLQWLFFAHGNLGPMQSQLTHFHKHAPEDIPYAKKRYLDETKRLFGVLDTRLQERHFLVGAGRGKFSLVDIKLFPWIRMHTYSGIASIDEWPNLKTWSERLEKEPSVVAGLQVPPQQ